MHRRSRLTTDRPRSARRIAALVSVLPIAAILFSALARGGLHPVTGLMAGAIATALAARWLITRYAAATARYLESRLGKPARRVLPSPGTSTPPSSRWRRLEAARTGLVVPAAVAKASRPGRA